MTPQNQGTILIVDDTPANISVLLSYLDDHGFRVLVARDGQSALEQAGVAVPDVILLDVMMPGMDGFETCRRLKSDPALQSIPVLFITALHETFDKVKGFEAGARDYITKPFQREEVLARVRTHLTIRRLHRELEVVNADLEQRVIERTRELEQLKDRLQDENTYLREEIRSEHHHDEIVGKSKTLASILDTVQRIADSDASVLILGETGTGKELIARQVHNTSRRCHRPLVKVNCAALPAHLIESQLFGHEKGAFTGAVSRKRGRFELGDGGTVFLDEIGELPHELQAKLLQVLQEGRFERLGATDTTEVDVRIIAATNRNLQDAIRTGDFREDLFYRLNVVPITLPPLRERTADIRQLAEFFIARCCRGSGKKIHMVPDTVVDLLKSYTWPGNIRELENVIERAVVLSKGPELVIDDSFKSTVRSDSEVTDLVKLKDIERNHIYHVLDRVNWIVGGPRGAASVLGLNPSTLRSKIKKLHITRSEKP